MKIIMRMILAIAAVLILNMAIPPQAAANVYACTITISGGRENVYVVVTDMDQDGNPMRQRGELF
jgi:hypothetical protein